MSVLLSELLDSMLSRHFKLLRKFPRLDPERTCIQGV